MKSCVELLQRMIGFDTVNHAIPGKEHPECELAIYLETIAKGWGLQTRRCPVLGGSFNLFISFERSADADWLLFDSHLDTVGLSGMSIDPLAAKCQGDKMFGRGACDTKGSGAAMLWALRRYSQNPRPDRNIGLLFSVDEEAGMSGAAAFAQTELRALAARTRGIVVGEPTELRPVVAHGGLLRGRIAARGRAAHSSDPAKGISAISIMVQIIQTLESRYVPSVSATHPLTGKAAASINVIRGGTQVNAIPDHCEVEFDRRIMPGEAIDSILPEIEKALVPVRSAWPKAQITIEPTFSLPPLDPKGNQAFTRFIAAVLQRATLDATGTGAPWATNASHYTTLVPAVVLGPGNIQQAHTKDEWISLAQLEEASEIYLQLMLQDE